jgi:lysophospholipase L1-like esterase
MSNLLDSDIRPFLHGVLRLEQLPDGALLHRMTASQVVHADRTERFRTRVRSAAGVRLSLATDSRTLRLRLVHPAAESAMLTSAAVDVEIDGRIVTHRFAAASMEQVNVDLPVLNASERRMRTVSLYLPYHRAAMLQAFDVEDGCVVEPVAPRPRKLLMIGDSITQGAYATSSFATMAVQLAALLDMELLNHGIGGHVFDEGILDPALDYEPDLVTVAYGTNDWNQFTQEQERERVRLFLRKLKGLFPAHTRIAVVTPLWRTDHAERRRGGTFDAFVAVIAEEVRAAGDMSHIDGYELVPHTASLFADGLHPNDTSMPLYAIRLFRALRQKGLA